ncbi:hypothetical protein AB0H92_11195, partial [Streptomyces phaeochromogenes]
MYLDGSVVGPAVDGPQDILALLGDRSTLARLPAFRIEEAEGTTDVAAYRQLRRDAFVHEQGLFARHDLDDRDSDPRTVVLVAKDPAGAVVGGVRLGPVDDGPDIGWCVRREPPGQPVEIRPHAARVPRPEPGGEQRP